MSLYHIWLDKFLRIFSGITNDADYISKFSPQILEEEIIKAISELDNYYEDYGNNFPKMVRPNMRDIRSRLHAKLRELKKKDQDKYRKCIGRWEEYLINR
ncbi:MAG: hypothetical protein QW727_03365 [Candidatus Pacearchaeota archaeon]